MSGEERRLARRHAHVLRNEHRVMRAVRWNTLMRALGTRLRASVSGESRIVDMGRRLCLK